MISKTFIILLFLTCITKGSTVQLLNNGPINHRINIVMLGDGYSQIDINNGVYNTHLSSFINYVFFQNQKPFNEYSYCFNVFGITTASLQSGADIPPQDVFKNTVFDASYYYDGYTERLLYINENKTNATITGENLGFVPNIKFCVVNSSLYGGGGGNFAVFAGGNGLSNEIALHEVGHSFGGFYDEYISYSGRYNGLEPNCPNLTKNNDPNTVKWKRFLGIDGIGIYEGGIYTTGIYRASYNSKMRNLGQPFDLVQQNALIQKIYNIVNPSSVGDANYDGLVDLSDLTILAAQWNTKFVDTDFNRDYTVDLSDLIILGANWSTQSNPTFSCEYVPLSPIIVIAIVQFVWILAYRNNKLR